MGEYVTKAQLEKILNKVKTYIDNMASGGETPETPVIGRISVSANPAGPYYTGKTYGMTFTVTVYDNKGNDVTSTLGANITTLNGGVTKRDSNHFSYTYAPKQDDQAVEIVFNAEKDGTTVTNSITLTSKTLVVSNDIVTVINGTQKELVLAFFTTGTMAAQWVGASGVSPVLEANNLESDGGQYVLTDTATCVNTDITKGNVKSVQDLGAQTIYMGFKALDGTVTQGTRGVKTIDCTKFNQSMNI